MAGPYLSSRLHPRSQFTPPRRNHHIRSFFRTRLPCKRRAGQNPTFPTRWESFSRTHHRDGVLSSHRDREANEDKCCYDACLGRLGFSGVLRLKASRYRWSFEPSDDHVVEPIVPVLLFLFCGCFFVNLLFGLIIQVHLCECFLHIYKRNVFGLAHFSASIFKRAEILIKKKICASYLRI